jgi:XapX domain-containing protein
MFAYRDWLLALVTGAVVGFIFAKLKLPAPAPPTIAGILGIAGIALGFMLGSR